MLRHNGSSRLNEKKVLKKTDPYQKSKDYTCGFQAKCEYIPFFKIQAFSFTDCKCDILKQDRMASNMSEADKNSYEQEKKYRQANCPVCTRIKVRGQKTVRHHHTSSEYVRELAALNGQKTFFCILCKKPEPVEFTEPRRKLILTSSTLYGVWNALELNLPFHIDIETIVGGKVRDATRALKNFLGKPEKLDVKVVCGLNNIGEGQHINDTIDEMMELKAYIMEHNSDNTVSFATLLLPPKFCSLYVPPANKALWDPRQTSSKG